MNLTLIQIILLMPKHTVKHEHTLVRLTTQQLVLPAVRTGLTERYNRSDRCDEN
jgi:hypothetical protein